MPPVFSKFCPDALFGGECTIPKCPRRKSHVAKFCELCASICLSSIVYSAHLHGHTELDRNGVSVSYGDSGVDFGILSPADAANGSQMDITVSTVAPVSNQSVIGATVWTLGGQHSSLFSVEISPATLLSGDTLSFPVRFLHTLRGRFEARLEITFKGAGGSTFIITRSLRAIVGEAAEQELLKPATAYTPRRRAPWRHNRPVVSGERPPALAAAPWVKKLTRARIPAELEKMLKTQAPAVVIAHVKTKYMQSSETLTKTNHSMGLRALLWVEEARAIEDLHMYDLTDARFVKEGSLYTLHVEGLSEKRPSVVVGDTILVQEANVKCGRTHEGFVHTVRIDNIRVSFHRSFDPIGRRYNVCFQLNRVPLRRQHQALCISSLKPTTNRLLFPTTAQAGLTRPLDAADSPITLFNNEIASNPSQVQAVKSILNLERGTAPFIVYGPPGTGKTVTVVEGICQILRLMPQSRILACAPSNSAADIICKRLTMLTTDDMFRCNAASRDPASVLAEVTPYTLHVGDHYGFPSLDKLRSYRLTVTTCGNASFAHNVGIAKGHYSHIIVDEAGQASEPEVLTAVRAMAGIDTKVVIAGDPKQLGPVIRSSIARELGLGRSYLERLVEMPLYSRHAGRGTSYVKLIKNYRSHDAILRYPNQQFYENELEACGPPAIIGHFLGSPQLVSPRFPIVFHSIAGANEREASSPSYFNIDEASQVKAYCQALLQDPAFPIKPEDIAVVTQYHAQVLKLRKLLREANMKGILVSSVENIQGQERMVVIMSTVRSSTDLLSYDAKFALGFIANPRRFNVAVTRAQALLIIVGDPSVLSIDPLWRGFMNYICVQGGWRGPPPPWDINAPVKTEGDYAEEIREQAAQRMNEFMDRLDAGEDIEVEANFDKPFVETD